jgi:ribosome-binding factor A
MAKEYSRTERIADLIHKELTAILQKEIADRQLRFVTITSVKVTKDLAFADILFTQLNFNSVQDKQAQQLASVERLKKAAPYLRHLLAQQLKQLRIIPRLRFFYDDLESKSQHLHDLIDQAITQDKIKRSG